MEPSECRRCDDYGVLDKGDWLARPTPCPDCALGKAEAAKRERDEEDRVNGAALRKLAESGQPWLVGYTPGFLSWAVRDMDGEVVDRRGTLPEAVAAAIGTERTEADGESV